MSISRDCQLMVRCARYLIRKILAMFNARISMGIYCKKVSSYKFKG